MTLSEYFEENDRGLGVLSTASSDGAVNSAVYGRPHVIEGGVIAFIMANRRSLHNLQSNPRASYLFREERKGYHGKRLMLRKIREEQDTEKVQALRRRRYSDEEEAAMKPLSLVFFEVVEERPLVGSF